MEPKNLQASTNQTKRLVEKLFSAYFIAGNGIVMQQQMDQVKKTINAAQFTEVQFNALFQLNADEPPIQPENRWRDLARMTRSFIAVNTQHTPSCGCVLSAQSILNLCNDNRASCSAFLDSFQIDNSLWDMSRVEAKPQDQFHGFYGSMLFHTQRAVIVDGQYLRHAVERHEPMQDWFYLPCPEHDVLRQYLREDKCVVVLGASGMGKTRLMVHATTERSTNDVCFYVVGRDVDFRVLSESTDPTYKEKREEGLALKIIQKLMENVVGHSSCVDNDGRWKEYIGFLEYLRDVLYSLPLTICVDEAADHPNVVAAMTQMKECCDAPLLFSRVRESGGCSVP